MLGRFFRCFFVPAAFRRLCVETKQEKKAKLHQFPAAFRRLCVETEIGAAGRLKLGPAAFRRLCVETLSS